MTPDEKKLLEAAKKLAQEFYDSAQALFDNPAMTETLYAGETMQALLGAQGYAEETTNGEG